MLTFLACKFFPPRYWRIFADIHYREVALGEGMRNYGRNSTENKNIYYTTAGSWSSSRFVDVFLWVVIQTNTSMGYNATSGLRHNFLPLNYTVALFHMHGFPANHSTGEALFGKGDVEKATYVKTSCLMQRDPTRMPKDLDPDAEGHITNLWTFDLFSIVKAYSVFYEPRMSVEAFNNLTVTIPTPRELFRFYQAYHITKDTQELSYATRNLSVRTPTVQLAAPTLGILLAYVVIMGVATVWWVFFKKLPPGTSIPRTKVQWMMQGLKEVGGRELNASYLDATWGQLEGDLARARYADVNDQSGRSYKTIQLGRGDAESDFLSMQGPKSPMETVETVVFLGGLKSMTM